MTPFTSDYWTVGSVKAAGRVKEALEFLGLGTALCFSITEALDNGSAYFQDFGDVLFSIDLQVDGSMLLDVLEFMKSDYFYVGAQFDSKGLTLNIEVGHDQY